MTAEPSFDPEGIIGVLESEGVEYVVIGGIAAGLYGSNRQTADLDIVPAPGRDNAERLASALSRLGARLKGVDTDVPGIDLSAQNLATGANFTLHTDRGDLDVMPEPEGLRPFEELARRATRFVLSGDLEVTVASRDDLIAMKRRAGRRQDIEDIVQLTVGLHEAASHARSLVTLSAALRPESTQDEALEAADVATAPYDEQVEISIRNDPAGDSRALSVEARLDGFTTKHAETWVSVTAAKLEASGVVEGAVEAEIRPT